MFIMQVYKYLDFGADVIVSEAGSIRNVACASSKKLFENKDVSHRTINVQMKIFFGTHFSLVM